MTLLKLALLFALSSSASAASITNGSFESFGTGFGGDGGVTITSSNTTLTGWTIVQRVGVLQPVNSYQLTPSQGSNFVDLTANSPLGGGAGDGVQQVIPDLVVGQTYQIALDLGISNSICLGNAINCTGPIVVQASAGGVSQSFIHNSALPGNVWSTYSFNFIAGSSSTPLEILLTSTPGFYAGLDNVRISAVPELPFSTLLTAGLFAVLCVRRRSMPSAGAA